MHLCGVRGSTPAPGIEFVRYGGHTSCVAIAHDGAAAPSLILDAGAGIQRVSRLLQGAPFDGTILLTHLHWDHVVGLPFFAGADNLDARVRVLLPEQESGACAERVLARSCRRRSSPSARCSCAANGSSARSPPASWRSRASPCSRARSRTRAGARSGYRITDGRSTLVYISDHCPTTLGPGEDGFGAYHPAALDFARDADVLLHDAQLFPAELAAEADFGHAVADYSVEPSLDAPGLARCCCSTIAMTAPTTRSTRSRGGWAGAANPR